MSRNAHAQAGSYVRRLPKCSRCKQQLMLVAASYGERGKVELEWECGKCNKFIPFHLLKEETPTDFEKFLNKRSGNVIKGQKGNKQQNNRKSNRKPKKRRRSNKRVSSNNKPN